MVYHSIDFKIYAVKNYKLFIKIFSIIFFIVLLSLSVFIFNILL